TGARAPVSVATDVTDHLDRPGAPGSRRSAAAALLGLLDLRVDRLVDRLQATGEVARLPGVPLDRDVGERLQMIGADRGNRARRRVGVREDLQERAEVLVGNQLR